jgi:hypothetical protein
MKWWNIIKGSCCDSCGNLNKEGGAVVNIAGSHDGKPQPKPNKALYHMKYGGEKDDKDEESDD